MPNSSASDRSQSSFPAGENDISRPLPLNANTLPVAGSTAGDAQAIRCGGTSLVNRLYLNSQSCLPVSALKQMSRSCNVGPEPEDVCRYKRSPNTTGEDRPPIGTRHARFSPLGDHDEGSPVSVDVPERAGPRHSGQSAAVSIAVAETARASATSGRRGRAEAFICLYRIGRTNWNTQPQARIARMSWIRRMPEIFDDIRKAESLPSHESRASSTE